VLVLDVSASMNDRCFARPSTVGEGCAPGSSTTLFVGLASRGAPSDRSAISSALCTYFRQALRVTAPSDVRLHRDRETDAWKGSCHLSWPTGAQAEAAFVALSAPGAPKLWGSSLRADRVQSDGDPRKGRESRAAAAKTESRMSVCKLALQRFSERAVALDLPHACGVILVGSDVSVQCRLTPALRLFAERAAGAMTDAQCELKGGCTRLLRGIEVAARELSVFGKNHQGARLRILAITDGEDTSGDDPGQAMAALCNEQVVLDIVALGGATGGMVAALADSSGGTVLQPVSERDALLAFESESLLQLSCRPVAQPVAVTPSPRALQLAAKSWTERLRAGRRAAVGAVQDEAGPSPGGLLAFLAEPRRGGQSAAASLAATLAKSAAVFGAPSAPALPASRAPSTPALAVVAAPPMQRPREGVRRLMHELREVMTHQHENLRISHDSDEAEIGIWHGVLSCQAASDIDLLYAGGAWRIVVRFPPEYPARPPSVYFVTPILHLNVSREGRVCHSALDREYSPNLPMTFLLSNVASLLVAPDPNDPFNEPLAMEYNRSLNSCGQQPPPNIDTPYRVLVRKAVLEHASAPAATLLGRPLTALLPPSPRASAVPPPDGVHRVAAIETGGEGGEGGGGCTSPQEAQGAQVAPTSTAALPQSNELDRQVALLRGKLSGICLDQYVEPLVGHGFDYVDDFYTMTADELRNTAAAVSMLPGHARRFVNLFSGDRLAAATATAAAAAAAAAAGVERGAEVVEQEYPSVDAVLVEMLSAALGVGAEGSIGEFIRRSNGLLGIEAPRGTLQQQAEFALAVLRGEMAQPPSPQHPPPVTPAQRGVGRGGRGRGRGRRRR